MTEQSRREQFIETIKNKLDELNEDIDRLEAKAKDASGKAEKKYEDQLKDVREKRTELKHKLTEVRASSEAQFEKTQTRSRTRLESTPELVQLLQITFLNRVSRCLFHWIARAVFGPTTFRADWCVKIGCRPMT